MNRITVKLKDGTEIVQESEYLYLPDMNQYLLEGKPFVQIGGSFIRIDSIEWLKRDCVGEDE